MSQTFDIDLVKLRCDHEQPGEPGSDEVYLVAFGVSGTGQRFAPKIIKVGDFSDGDVTPASYRTNLFSLTLDRNETIVATSFVVFERDSGDMAGNLSKIGQRFNNMMDTWTKVSQPYGNYQHIHAFALTMMHMPFFVEVSGQSFWNDDDVDPNPMFIDHFASSFAELPNQRAKHHFRVSTEAGLYFFEFEARFSPPDPVLDPGLVTRAQ